MDVLETICDQAQIPLSAVLPFFTYDTGQSYLLAIAGAHVLPLWYRLRCMSHTTGMWPLILGDHVALADHEDRLRHAQRMHESDHILVAAALRSSLTISPQAWFMARAHLWNALPRPAVSSAARLQSDAPLLKEPPWMLASNPYMFEPNTCTIPTVMIYASQADAPDPIQQMPSETVYLVLLPTTVPWQSPAYLAYERWNDAPSLASHLAVWRWWYERYHAEIIGIAYNTIEAWIRRLPRDELHLQEVAWEQYVYCPDIRTCVDDLVTYLHESWIWSFVWH